MSLRTLYNEELTALMRGRFAWLGAGVVLLGLGGLAAVATQDTWLDGYGLVAYFLAPLMFIPLAAGDNVTSFLSSHDAQEIRSMCARISVVAGGRLVFTGATQDIGSDLDTFEEALVGLLMDNRALSGADPGL